MIDEKIIENAQGVIYLIEKDILTKEEVRKMLGVGKKLEQKRKDKFRKRDKTYRR